MTYEQPGRPARNLPATARPRTAAEWAAHAEELHKDGLAVIDMTAGTFQTAAVTTQHNTRAAALFAGAQSAAAMAAYTYMADGLTP